MRTENAPTVRLADYAPPDFLADERRAELPAGAARRRGCGRGSSFRRNPARDPAADLRLDGRALRLVSAAIDGAPVPQNALARGRRGADRRRPRTCRDGFVWEAETEIDPGGEHRARGALHVARHVLHPVRGAGLPQDHLLARPARRDGALPGARSRATAPVLLSNGNLVALGAAAGPSGRTRSRSPPTCSRWSPATSSRSRTASSPVRARGAAADLGARRRRGPLRLRHGRAEAGDGLGRGGLRPRVRPRPLHDRRGRRLQHGGDGEQGAQRLQLAATCWRAPRPPPTATTSRSRRSSRTSISTTGPATASPAATGSSSASRRG